MDSTRRFKKPTIKDKGRAYVRLFQYFETPESMSDQTNTAHWPRQDWNRKVRAAHMRLRLQAERIKTWRGFWTTPAYAWIRRMLGKPDAWSVAQPKLDALDKRRWRIARRYGM